MEGGSSGSRPSLCVSILRQNLMKRPAAVQWAGIVMPTRDDFFETFSDVARFIEFPVGSFSVLPLYLNFAEGLPALKAFGGIVLLLTWLYLMGNIVMLGAELNWWYGRGRPLVVEAHAREDEELGHS